MYEHIVVGTDGSDRAAQAVQHAADLAAATGAALHVVQGCGSPIVTSPILGDTAAINPHEIVAACEADLQPLHESLIQRSIDSHVHVVPEAGSSAVCDVAAKVHADLIVVGNRGMTGKRRILGSVPNSIAHQAPCAVLIVQTR